MDYLQNPELVARFQRRCGLFLVEGARCNGGTTHAPTGAASPFREPRGQLEGKREEQEKNAKVQSDARRRAAAVSVAKMQKVHIKGFKSIARTHARIRKLWRYLCLCVCTGVISAGPVLNKVLNFTWRCLDKPVGETGFSSFHGD